MHGRKKTLQPVSRWEQDNFTYTKVPRLVKTVQYRYVHFSSETKLTLLAAVEKQCGVGGIRCLSIRLSCLVTGLCVAPEQAHAPCWQESDLAFASCSKFEAIERVPIACFTNSALFAPSIHIRTLHTPDDDGAIEGDPAHGRLCVVSRHGQAPSRYWYTRWRSRCRLLGRDQA